MHSARTSPFHSSRYRVHILIIINGIYQPLKINAGNVSSIFAKGPR